MPATVPAKLLNVIARHWGFRGLRPLQADAMVAELNCRDSLVVMPTGAGKSLCYQAPAVFRGGTTAVVSPLIALMKDQVDSLRRNGVPAVRLDSSLSLEDISEAETAVRRGQVRLVFVSPERLVTSGCQSLLRAAKVSTFAIDEAHCISHWGHDFRPEYRQMGRLKELFPGSTVHAYTATATESVRRDIVDQLSLDNPTILVGNFDRPNLTYRVLPRTNVNEQVREFLERYPDQAGVIYCLRRADVESIAGSLKAEGRRVVPYHAGMSTEERKRSHDAFTSEVADVVVATVAFGMGIDRPDVRFVLHVAMPKSLEHYQQEAGRAGRDGEPAECALLYSGADVLTLKSIIEKSANEGGAGPEFLANANKHLEEMARYCRGAVCRHRALVQYFGQKFEKDNCNACDLCLGETDEVPDATVAAQKILSCVARVQESFGVGHVVAVLRGEDTETVRGRGHDKLTTYGLLRQVPRTDLRDWVYQLVGQEVLTQTDGEYPLLKLNPASWDVMRGHRTVRLIQLPKRTKKSDRSRGDSPTTLTANDHTLFEELRQLRRQLAAEEGVPPYVIFHDSVLHDLARVRPLSTHEFLLIPKVGEAKVWQYALAFLQVISAHTLRASGTTSSAAKKSEPSARKKLAFERFRTGAVVEDVMHETGLSRGTVSDYLSEFIRAEKPAGIAIWVHRDTMERVAVAAKQVGIERLKPIFESLGGNVSYEEIRIVLAYLSYASTG